MKNFLSNNKGYLFAVVVPLALVIFFVVYFSNFAISVTAPSYTTETPVQTMQPEETALWETASKSLMPADHLALMLHLQQKKPEQNVVALFNIEDYREINNKFAIDLEAYKTMEFPFYIPEKQQEEEHYDYKLTSIVFHPNPNYRRAMIDGAMLRVGDKLKNDDAKITEINKDEVHLTRKGRKIVLKLE